MEQQLKEVYFHTHCPLCEHEKVPENEHPCDVCLEIPGREYSHRPEHFKPKEVKKGANNG